MEFKIVKKTKINKNPVQPNSIWKFFTRPIYKGLKVTCGTD